MRIPLELPRRKRNATLERKALAVIEALTSDDFCQDLEITKPDDFLTRKLLRIYEAAHIGLGNCQGEHEDWENELLKAYRYFKRHKIL